MRDGIFLEINKPKAPTLSLGDTKIIGQEGENGATFYPEVSENGIISWTNDKGLDNPAPVNIRGSDGEDGYSPTINVSKIAKGNRVSINDKNGTKYIDILNGDDGEDGEDGRGISSIFKSSTNGLVDNYTINFTDGSQTTFSVTNGKNGIDGKDGTPATHQWQGTRLVISSASGTSSADLRGERGIQGVQGEQGEQGRTGADGVGILSIEKTDTQGIRDIYTITLTDGTIATFSVTNGIDGDDGVSVTNASIDSNGNLVISLSNGNKLTLGKVVGANGKDGIDGYTPVKGKDYFTEADKTEIVNDVLAALPNAEGVGF